MKSWGKWALVITISVVFCGILGLVGSLIPYEVEKNDTDTIHKTRMEIIGAVSGVLLGLIIILITFWKLDPLRQWLLLTTSTSIVSSSSSPIVHSRVFSPEEQYEITRMIDGY